MLLTLVAAGSFAFAAGGLNLLHAQQGGLPAEKANAQTSPGTTAKPSAVEQDSRMVEYRRRAKARWRAQQITARKAEAEYHRARLEREIAEITLLDYQESGLTQDLGSVDGEIALLNPTCHEPRIEPHGQRGCSTRGL